MTKRKVLFICYGGGHSEVISPLYTEALNRGFEPQILALTTAYMKLSSKGMNCISLESLLHLFPTSALTLGKKLVKDLPLNPSVPLSESRAYLGLGYWDLESRLGHKEAEKQYAEHGRQAFLQLNVAKVILKHLSPSFCITTSSPRMEEAFIRSSKELSIPCYMVLENFNLPDYQSKFCNNDYADLIFCPNEKSKQILTQLGRSPQDLIVSKNPAFEKHSTQEAAAGGKAFRAKHLKGKKLVVFAMAPKNSRFYDFDVKIRKALMQECEDLNYSLILRPHPSDYNFTSSEVTVSFSEKLSHLLNACDILVTQISTVGQEAHQLGKASLHVLDRSTNETYGYFYEDIGVKKVGLDGMILGSQKKEKSGKNECTSESLSPSNLIWNKIEEDLTATTITGGTS